MQIKSVKSVKSVGVLVKNTPKMSKICLMDSNDSFPINNQSRTMSSHEIIADKKNQYKNPATHIANLWPIAVSTIAAQSPLVLYPTICHVS